MILHEFFMLFYQCFDLCNFVFLAIQAGGIRVGESRLYYMLLCAIVNYLWVQLLCCVHYSMPF